jgi:hypothetical protein
MIGMSASRHFDAGQPRPFHIQFTCIGIAVALLLVSDTIFSKYLILVLDKQAG